MSDVNCRNLEYTIVVPSDKFDLDGFRTGIGAKPEAIKEHRVCNTRNMGATDYHVHLVWEFDKKAETIEFEIDYVGSPHKPRPNETEPFAEDLMSWLGKYFKFSDASATVIANFVFRKDRSQIIFPLPIKTTVTDLGWEAEIKGFMCEFPAKPDGLRRVYVTHTDDILYLGVHSERRVEFATFSVSSELEWARAMSERLVR